MRTILLSSLVIIFLGGCNITGGMGPSCLVTNGCGNHCTSKDYYLPGRGVWANDTPMSKAKIGSNDLDTSVLTEIEKTSKNVIASVDVAGYVVDKSDITQEGTQYRAFVLIAYNNEEATKIMMNRMKRDKMIYSRIRSTEAWKELEDEVNKSKEEDEAKSMENIERLIDENEISI